MLLAWYRLAHWNLCGSRPLSHGLLGRFAGWNLGCQDRFGRFGVRLALDGFGHRRPSAAADKIRRHLQDRGHVLRLGGILGASIGVLATVAIASNDRWTPVMNTTLVLASPFLGVAVGVLAGCYPAIRAARITPMAALRS